MPDTDPVSSAFALWPDLSKAAGLDGQDWQLEVLARRNDPGVAGVVLRADAPGGQRLTFKHALRPWNPERYAAQYAQHQDAYDSFPAAPDLAISRPLYLDAAAQAAIFDHAPGRNLRDVMRHDCPDPAGHLPLLEQAGRWLDRFHRARLGEERAFTPGWAVNHYAGIRDGVEAGSFAIPAPEQFLQGVSAIERLAPSLAGQPTRTAVQHGDFHMGNLVWDGRRLTGIDITAGHPAPVGHDINKFLMDYTRRFRPPGDLAPGQCVPPDVLEAFFSGYRLVGPDDPGVRLFALTQMLEIWMLIPRKRAERTRAKQECLQQIRPLAKRAFAPGAGAAPDRELRVLLSERSVAAARKGQHGFTPYLARAAARLGVRLSYRRDSEGARANARVDGARTLLHMAEPIDRRGLCFRKAYAEPFWRIEATGARWDWPVARAAFTPGDPQAAARFFDHWQAALHPQATRATRDERFIYMPLQGRLFDHRSFQVCAPVQMIRHTLAQSDLPIRATLHPNETYSDAERTHLAELERDEPRFRLYDLPMNEALPACSYVVTENSSAGFHALFYDKPVILFAGIDFHHICLNVAEIGVQEAFDRVKTHHPDRAAYLHWFWGTHALNLSAPGAEQAIAARLTELWGAT